MSGFRHFKTLTGDTILGVHLIIICYQPNLKLTKSYGYLKSGLRHFKTLTGDTILGVHLYNLLSAELKIDKVIWLSQVRV